MTIANQLRELAAEMDAVYVDALAEEVLRLPIDERQALFQRWDEAIVKAITREADMLEKLFLAVTGWKSLDERE